MSQYIVLGSFTDQGIRNVKETSKRAKALSDLAKGMGVSVKEVYWTLGDYDLVLILEAQDDKAAASLMMKAGSLGNFKSQTLPAFNTNEIDSILSKV